MIIDFHTHIWPGGYTTETVTDYFKSRNLWDESFSALTSEYLLNIMDKNKISTSVIHSVAVRQDMQNDDLAKINLYVYKEVNNDPKRLVGFFTLNPSDTKNSQKIITRSVEKFNLSGLKLHPSIQKFFPNDKKLFPVYKIMQDYGLPIMFHTGSVGIIPFQDKFSNPIYIDEVACNFPELKIILGHAGKIWHDETVMLMRKHKNLYAEISANIGRNKEFSALPLAWLLYKIKVWVGNLDRVLFGSDYPFYFQSETIECLNKAAEHLNKENKDFITGEDLEKIYSKNSKDLINQIKSLQK
jgi:uncharacterized protein